MAVTWIITDIDGCLSPEESIPWDLDLFLKFAKLSRDASAGRGPLPPITLCTGRPQPYAEVLAKLLDIRAPIVCENGAVIYSLHDNWARYAPGITSERIRGLRAVRAFIETEILPAHPDVLLQFGKEAQMSVFSKHPELFPSIQERIADFVTRNGCPKTILSPSHYYLNISIDGVDKGTTLRMLIAELGAARKDVAGIGDTEGDLPLRDSVGFFACPANAKPAIKDVAEYVSPYPTLEGVLDILSRPEFQRGTAKP